MRLSQVVVASKNPDKIAEIEEILRTGDVAGEIVRGLEWDDIPETEPTLEGNALLKARAVAAATGLPAIADDTGLEVEALGGAPGVRTARYAGPDASYADNVTALLSALDGVDDRRARFRTVMALVTPDGTELIAEGEIVGSIASSPRGESGFGYDPVFEVDGRTLAEMPTAEKHAISHRGRAIRSLVTEIRGA